MNQTPYRTFSSETVTSGGKNPIRHSHNPQDVSNSDDEMIIWTRIDQAVAFLHWRCHRSCRNPGDCFFFFFQFQASDQSHPRCVRLNYTTGDARHYKLHALPVTVQQVNWFKWKFL